jgi:hypothetical protein
VLGVVFAALALGSLVLDGTGRSVADEKQAKEVRKTIEEMADAFAKGDTKTVEKLVGKLKNNDTLLDAMSLFKPREADGSGGLGLGKTPGAIMPDCIDRYLINNLRKPLNDKVLAKDAADIERAAYICAAVSELTQYRCPIDKKKGEMDPKDWDKWSKGMKQEALNLAKAAKDKDAMAVKKAMSNLYSNCSGCHGVFRGE